MESQLGPKLNRQGIESRLPGRRPHPRTTINSGIMYKALGSFLTPKEPLELERPNRLRQRQYGRDERTHEPSQRDFYVYIARQNHELFVEMMRHDQQLRRSRFTSKLYTKSRTQQPLPPPTIHGGVLPLPTTYQGPFPPLATQGGVSSPAPTHEGAFGLAPTHVGAFVPAPTHGGAFVPAPIHGGALNPASTYGGTFGPATTHGGGLPATTTYDGPLPPLVPHAGFVVPATTPGAALPPPKIEGVITIPNPEATPSRMGAGVPLSTAKVEVVPVDSFDTAESLYAQGRKGIVVLNMANADTPGGWYLSGAGAQEEALCRRSSLYMCLSECARNNFYPIPPEGAIFSPDVLIIRKSDEQKCKLLGPKERWWTSVISVAGLFRPPTTEDGAEFLRGEDRADARRRIRTVIRVAAMEGKKNLVLSALGCGAFKNPPLAVAILFGEVLQEVEFRGRFEGVWFSVLDRKGSSNYDIFCSVLQGLPI